MLASMLQANELIISQSKAIGRDEFTISDPNGGQLGIARQTRKLSDLFKASRGVEVFDAGGTPVLAVEDPVNVIRDRYIVHRADPQNGGQAELAHITKRFAWIGAKYDVDIVGFPQVEIQGEVFQLNYALTCQGAHDCSRGCGILRHGQGADGQDHIPRRLRTGARRECPRCRHRHRYRAGYAQREDARQLGAGVLRRLASSVGRSVLR